MRKLKTSDIPVFCRCLKKIGLKEQFRTIAQEANNAKDVWDRGYEIIWGLFDAITEPAGETALYEFLAGPFEMTPKEIKNLDMNVLVDSIKQLIQENDFGTFFGFAAKSMM